VYCVDACRRAQTVNLENALWFAYIGVEAVVVGLLLYRRLFRALPIFFSFCVWDVLSNLGTFVTSRYHAIDFHVYFGETLLDSAMEFCVLVELGWSVLRPLRSSLPRSTPLVIGALILLAGAVIWPFAAFNSLAHYTTSRQWLFLTQLQHTVSILRILFFLFLAAGSQLLSIGWRDRELQVATGLGFYSLVNMTVSIFQSRQSTGPQYVRLEEIVVAGFICSLAYWVISFAQKEAARREFTPQMEKLLLAMAGSARTTRVAMAESRTDKARKQK
jgi:hypothetical protein